MFIQYMCRVFFVCVCVLCLFVVSFFGGLETLHENDPPCVVFGGIFNNAPSSSGQLRPHTWCYKTRVLQVSKSETCGEPSLQLRHTSLHLLTLRQCSQWSETPCPGGRMAWP